MNKTAVVIGSTGLIGRELVNQLCDSEAYSKVISLLRTPSGTQHKKLSEHIVDFDKTEDLKKYLQGADVLFSAMGTTRRQAGSKAAQRKVDFDYQYKTAKLASKIGVPKFVLVSSAGAKSNSLTFYMRIKGELEDAVMLLPFNSIQIMKPAQLDGDRIENRPTEKIGLKLMHGINKLGIAKKFRPVHAEILAAAMIRAAENSESARYEFDEIFDLVKNS